MKYFTSVICISITYVYIFKNVLISGLLFKKLFLLTLEDSSVKLNTPVVVNIIFNMSRSEM